MVNLHRIPEGAMAEMPNQRDDGHQYAKNTVYSEASQGILRRFGMVASLSRPGNGYDNAPMESFWGTLKSELVYNRSFQSRDEAMQAIAEYSGGLIHVYSALFEGRLMVTAAEQFKKALETGIGHGKVMGLGMLSIIPVHP